MLAHPTWEDTQMMFDKIKKKYELELPLLEANRLSHIRKLLDEQLLEPDRWLSLVASNLNSILNIPCDYNDRIIALDISENPIDSLSGIERFPNLRILVARKCNISKIPTELSLLQDLFHVNLAENLLIEEELTRIPDWIIYLDISRNNIYNLPKEFEKLSNLYFLYSSGNKLSHTAFSMLISYL